MKEKDFNLLDEKWICVLKDGKPDEVSLRQVFELSNHIDDIIDVSPMVVASVLRFLLAIMYSAFRSNKTWKGNHKIESKNDWQKLYNDPDGTIAQILAYLETAREYFWLFHPERPFYQKPDLRLKESKNPEDGKMPIGKLRMYAANSAQGTLFDHSLDGDMTSQSLVTPSEATRLLLAFHNYDIGGAGTAEYHGDGEIYETKYLKDALLRGEAINIWQCGKLFTTLLVNLVPEQIIKDYKKYNYPEPSSNDSPSFEHMPSYFWTNCRVKTDKGDVEYIKDVYGIMDYLTWQARKTKLFTDDKGNIVSFARTKGVRLSENFNSILDPYIIYEYREDKLKWLSKIRLDPMRQGWRNIDSILTNSYSKQKNVLPALNTRFLSELLSDSLIEKSNTRLLLACHYQNTNERLKHWTVQTYPIPSIYLENEAFVDGLEIALGMAEKVSKGLYFSGRKVSEILETTKEDGSGKVQNPMQLESEYWPLLENPFMRLVHDLGMFNDDSFWQEETQDQIKKIFINWQKTVSDSAHDVFDKATSSVKLDYRGMKAITLGKKVLDKQIMTMKSIYQIEL